MVTAKKSTTERFLALSKPGRDRVLRIKAQMMVHYEKLLKGLVYDEEDFPYIEDCERMIGFAPKRSEWNIAHALYVATRWRAEQAAATPAEFH